MAEILGKVTASHEIPRGADVSLRIGVPAEWLNLGRTIEVELPRNLLCARCSGGGCDACRQSGAITLRGKSELPEVVQVVLPLQRLPRASDLRMQPAMEASVEATPPPSGASPESQPSSARPVVIRIPECGGLPDANNGAIVRGWLLLEVIVADRPSPNVRWIEDEEPLSSSKMLRADVRPSKNSAMEGGHPIAAASADPHGTPLPESAAEAPPSRIAKTAQHQRDQTHAAVSSLQQHEAASSAIQPVSRATGIRFGRRAQWSAIYLGIVFLALIGIVLLILL